jgi:Mn2+/Fe2+ NRAMP family transporter
MKKIFEIALGIVTSVGGFLEAGSIITAVQAGAEFHTQLIWAVALGGLCVIFLVEMSGRFAAVSKHTIPDALRERFGIYFFVWCSVPLLLVMLLVLAAEIGGVCVALELATGLAFRWWAIPVGFLTAALLWKGSFGVIEKGVSLLGLITLSFIVALFWLKPDWNKFAGGLLPTAPEHDKIRYWFLAVNILGASISPYLMYFYSSGAVEDKWDESYLTTNRIVAAGGMSFGTLISIAVLGLAALLFHKRGIQLDHYSQLPLILIPVFGFAGFVLFISSFAIACFGAALEVSLEAAYLIAQGFGWNWGKNMRPRDGARFSLAYLVIIFFGALLIFFGIDPMKLTVLSMALTAATLPLAITPFLLLMNDEHYLQDHTNRWFSNTVVFLITLLAALLAVVTIPLQIFGG